MSEQTLQKAEGGTVLSGSTGRNHKNAVLTKHFHTNHKIATYIQRHISGRCNQAYKSLATASAVFLFFRVFFVAHTQSITKMVSSKCLHITITYWNMCIHGICKPKPFDHQNCQSRLSQQVFATKKRADMGDCPALTQRVLWH